MIRRIVERIKASRFLRSAGMLAGGTAVGQLIVFAASPLLTRLFTPEDFGVLALYTSVLAILAVVADLRYSMAIPLPEDEDDALALLALSVIVALLFAVLTGLVLWWGDDAIARFLSVDMAMIRVWAWLLPLGLIATTGYSALTYWATRQNAFRQIASRTMLQSIGKTVAQISLGLLGVGRIGMILGETFGRALGIGSLVRLVLEKADLRSITLPRINKVASRYRRFPLLATLSSLLSNAGLYLPSIVLLNMYDPATAGFYALSQRVFGAPVRLMTSSVSLVYFSEAARLAREQPRALRRLFRRTTGRLFLISIIPAATLVAIGPALFRFVFGDAWITAGEFTRPLAIVFVGQLTVTTITQTLNVIGLNGLQLAWNVLRLTFVVASFALAMALAWDPGQAILAYAIAMGVAYLLLWLLIDRALLLSGRADVGQSALADD